MNIGKSQSAKGPINKEKENLLSPTRSLNLSPINHLIDDLASELKEYNTTYQSGMSDSFQNITTQDEKKPTTLDHPFTAFSKKRENITSSVYDDSPLITSFKNSNKQTATNSNQDNYVQPQYNKNVPTNTLASNSPMSSIYSPVQTRKTTRPTNAIRSSILTNKQQLENSELQNLTLNADDSIASDANNTLPNTGPSNTFDFDNTLTTITTNNSSPMKPTTAANNTTVDSSDYAYLFIMAVHSFDTSTLENENDKTICLDFDKYDVAFVHNVDESGWGEVTLIKNEKRGWIPFNYFEDTIKTVKGNKTIDIINSRIPMKLLLSASAQFLLNPQNFRLPGTNSYTFNVDYINRIRDGVKQLLEMTNCVSRSNELVKSKPRIKKARKRLLAEWYNLMIKADSYKQTTSSRRIEKLTAILYQVLKMSFNFFVTWSHDILEYEKEMATTKSIDPMKPSNTHFNKPNLDIKNLDTIPFAKSRLNEIHCLLFNYIAIILGRLDLIEHNPIGCEALELIVHQIIMLLRELLYISKSCSFFIQEKYQNGYENTLDSNLDPLLSLVSDLISTIKDLVTKTIHDDYKSDLGKEKVTSEIYQYTQDGSRLINIICQMTALISKTVQGVSNYLKLIGDFELDSDRKYPNFKLLKITPADFIKKCSIGLAKNIDYKKLQSSYQMESVRKKNSENKNISLSRYSTIRAGNSKNEFTYQGTQLLQNTLNENKSFDRYSIFEKYTVDNDEKSDILTTNDTDILHDELVRNSSNNIIGGSFRALVIKLTDEIDKADDFLIFSFLLNFRIFGTPETLIEILIERFDTEGKRSTTQTYNKSGPYSSSESRIKNRRRIICNIFNIWMETFWNYTTDFTLLPTMINFFNEGVCEFLPIEGKLLIEVAAKLMNKTSLKRNSNIIPKGCFDQLKVRSIQPSSTSSILSEKSIARSSIASSILTLDENLIEEYELIDPLKQKRDSFSLELPILNLGNYSLLSKEDVQNIERSLDFYKQITNKTKAETNSLRNINLQTKDIIDNWIRITIGTTLTPRFDKLQIKNLVSFNALEAAKQLTLLESTLYMEVQPFELINENFLQKKKLAFEFISKY